MRSTAASVGGVCGWGKNFLGGIDVTGSAFVGKSNNIRSRLRSISVLESREEREMWLVMSAFVKPNTSFLVYSGYALLVYL